MLRGNLRKKMQKQHTLWQKISFLNGHFYGINSEGIYGEIGESIFKSLRQHIILLQNGPKIFLLLLLVALVFSGMHSGQLFSVIVMF